jgi:hypothetical protein
MTYSTGGLIQASDYNTFQNNLNAIWGTGSGDSGWGQTAISAVSTGGIVTATNWATLVNNLATAGAQEPTTITSRTAPVTGNVIGILSNVTTDITNCTTNRGNAASAGTEVGYTSGTTSATGGASNGSQGAWQIRWVHTVTFPSADQARYFFNAGGRVRLQFGKTSTGTDLDPDWNQLADWVGSIYLAGYVNNAAQTIAGVSYTGTTRIGGTGGNQTTLTTTSGWYQLGSTVPGLATFVLYSTTSPYTTSYIIVQAATSSTVLTLSTTWSQQAVSAAGTTTNISGGSAPAVGATSIGGATAPTTLCTYIPPSTAQGLSASWGTPSIAASVTVVPL